MVRHAGAMHPLLVCLLIAGCAKPVEEVRILDRQQHLAAVVQRRDGMKEGPVTILWPDGSVRVAGQYIADRPEGWWQSFHANGHQRSISHYADGMKEGLRIYWDSLGQPMRSERFVKGIPDGPFFRFFPDGRAAQHSCYRNGLLEGPHDQWYTDRGGCHVNGFFHLGHEEGLWTEYDMAGHMVWQAYLKDGEVTRAIYGKRRRH